MGLFSSLLSSYRIQKQKENCIDLVKESNQAFERTFHIQLDNPGDFPDRQYDQKWQYFQIWYDIHNYIALATFNVYARGARDKITGVPIYDNNLVVNNKIISKQIYKYVNGQWEFVEEWSRNQLIHFMIYECGYQMAEEIYEYNETYEHIIARFPSNQNNFLQTYGFSEDYWKIRL